jgi:hypothetical protein
MFEVLFIIRINTSVVLQAVLNFHLVRDAFPYWEARAIALKDGVPYPQQSKVRTTPPSLH